MSEEPKDQSADAAEAAGSASDAATPPPNEPGETAAQPEAGEGAPDEGDAAAPPEGDALADASDETEGATGETLEEAPSEAPAEEPDKDEAPDEASAEEPDEGEAPDEASAEEAGEGEAPDEASAEEPDEGEAPDEASAEEPGEGEAPDEASAEEAGEGEALDLSKSKLAAAPAPEAEESADTADEAQPEPVDFDAVRRTIEALLFASESVLTAREMARAASTKTSAVRKVLEAMQAAYEQEGRAWMLAEIAGGWRLVTRPEYFGAIQKLKAQRAQRKLTPAALETLALIAYSKEPVGRADIESVRGVDAGPILRQLLDRKLVKIAGRSEGLGRALMYTVTTDFLEHFGLKSTEELPRAGEFKNA